METIQQQLPCLLIAGITALLWFFLWLSGKFGGRTLQDDYTDLPEEEQAVLTRQGNAIGSPIFLVVLVLIPIGICSSFPLPFPFAREILGPIFVGVLILTGFGGMLYAAISSMRSRISIFVPRRANQYPRGERARMAGQAALWLALVIIPIVALSLLTQASFETQLFNPFFCITGMVILVGAFILLQVSRQMKKGKQDSSDSEDEDVPESGEKRVLDRQHNARNLFAIFFLIQLCLWFLPASAVATPAMQNILNLATNLNRLAGLIGINYLALSAIIHRISILRDRHRVEFPRGGQAVFIGLVIFLLEIGLFGIIHLYQQYIQ